MVNAGVVSVIVPVYNVELYLRRCIDSLLKQTYPYLEIILVDDGSPDNCGNICDEYASVDSRIRVIHKGNAGLGMARNSGLDIATGDFVVFVDSDDYVKDCYVEILLRNMVETGADLATVGHYRHSCDGKMCQKPITQMREIWEKSNIVERVLLPIVGSVPEYPDDVEREMSVWINMYRRSLIEKNALRFVSEREYISEDIFFNILYMLNAEKVVLCPECLYIYSENPTSLTSTYRIDRFEKYCKMFWEEQEILDGYGLADKAKLRLYRTFIMKTCKCISMIVESENSAKEKYRLAAEILESPLLHEVISEYRPYAMGFKQNLRAYLVEQKQTSMLLILYWMKTFRKQIMRLRERMVAFGKEK